MLVPTLCTLALNNVKYTLYELQIQLNFLYTYILLFLIDFFKLLIIILENRKIFSKSYLLLISYIFFNG